MLRRLSSTGQWAVALAAMLSLIGSACAKDRLALETSDFGIKTTITARQQDEQGFKPRTDVEPWPLALPLDWGADPFKDRNWRFQLNSLRLIDPFLASYEKGADPVLLKRAFAFVDDWYHFNMVEKRPNEYAWYDMAVGLRAMRIAYLFHLVETGRLKLATEQRQHLNDLVDEHARRLQVPSFIQPNNHGLSQVFGLNLLCTAAEARPTCTDGKRFAGKMFDKLLDIQFTDEGVHREHSPSYHLYVVNMIDELGGVEHFESPKAKQILERARAVSRWLVLPDNYVVSVGDSGGKARLPEPAAEPDCIASDRCFLVGDYTKSGYAIVRSKSGAETASMLFVMGMANNKVHKHADDLSFELLEFGRLIFVDSGKYGYNPGAIRSYVQSADAHNTIAEADTAIRPNQVEMKGSLLEGIEKGAQGFVVRGKAVRPKLFEQSRTIIYDPGRSLTIRDDMTSSQPRRYVSSLHLAPDLAPVLRKSGFDLKIGERTMRAHLEEQDCELSVTRGQKDPPLGWRSVGYLQVTPTSVVRATCPGNTRSITWIIAFS